MNFKDKIFLMGMPGSGKTTVGKRLAKALAYEFIDLDQYIEKRENCSINDIFRHQGENYFRTAETDAIKEVSLLKSKTIVSLGGGTPCFNNNIDLLLESGLCVYIKASDKLLLNRLENAKSQRPLFWGLTKQEIEKKLQQMINARAPFYEKAHLTTEAVNFQEKELIALINSY
jgi:shikimate kinase